MTKYIAVANYTPSTVELWSSTSPGAWTSTGVTYDVPNANYVALYQDQSVAVNPCYMIVADADGSLYVYAFPSLAAIVSGDPVAPTVVPFTGSPVGMAIQPGSGDLYVANYYGGISCFTNASQYATQSTFIDEAPGSGGVCGDLAFDPGGNLWLSSFNGSDPTTHRLTCFTDVGLIADVPASPPYVQFGNATAPNLSPIPLNSASLPSGKFYAFSEPLGIAFDPHGNLWVVNDDDDATVYPSSSAGGHATALRISFAWIQSILNDPTTYPNQSLIPVHPATPAIPAATAYYPSTYSKFGAVIFDGFELYVEDEAQDIIWAFGTSTITDKNTAPAALSFKKTAVTATYPGNGGLAIFNPTPATLLIRDVPEETDAQPTTLSPGQSAYESVDIATSEASINNPPTVVVNEPFAGNGQTGYQLASESIVGNMNAFVQVRVANIGGTTTSGSEVLKVYWAFSGSGLGWPEPWAGLAPFNALLSLGGLVGAVPVGSIPAGMQEIFEIPWIDVPNPNSYETGGVTEGHFCLVARIESSSLYPHGMPYPEGSDLTGQTNVIWNNVLNNSPIGWRNIVITPPADIHRPRFPVLAGNYGREMFKSRFAIEMLDAKGEPAHFKGRITVHTDGPVRDRLLESGLDEKHSKHEGGGKCHLHHHTHGLKGIQLHTNEGHTAASERSLSLYPRI